MAVKVTMTVTLGKEAGEEGKPGKSMDLFGCCKCSYILI